MIVITTAKHTQAALLNFVSQTSCVLQKLFNVHSFLINYLPHLDHFDKISPSCSVYSYYVNFVSIIIQKISQYILLSKITL